MKIVDYEQSTPSESDEEEETEAQASSFSCVSWEFRRHEVGGQPSKTPLRGGNVRQDESAPSSSSSSLKRHFMDMGFSENMVERAIKQNENGEADAVLETLLTYSALDDSSLHVYSPHDLWSSNSEGNMLEDEQSDAEGVVNKEEEFKEKEEEEVIPKEYVGTTSRRWSEESVDNQESVDNLSGTDKKRLLLVDMGFPIDEIALAIDRCGENASICELADSIYASQTDKSTHASCSEYSTYVFYNSSGDDEYFPERMDKDILGYKGRMKWFGESSSVGIKRKPNAAERNPKGLKRPRSCDLDDEEAVRSALWVSSNAMTGFGLPNEPNIRTFRKLPDAAIGPPYFYYENVALTPKGVWETISRFLYDIAPEFVDSKYFSASARKRGYIHNLPIDNRFQVQPIPPLTIQEVLPYTNKWWPSWDPRKKLNCINTCSASAKLTERLLKIVADSDGMPSYSDQQRVLEQCRKWNLVWVGLHKLAPLEPDEIEPLLGFPKHHTRGGGVSRTERLRALGNSFQVDTVAYHLSVLKRMFPNGLNVLSLFSGIGGAEVALHRLGIPLKNIVSVELSEVSRNIMKNWWTETGQKGKLVEIADVQQLTSDKLESMMSTFGGFDLVIGGSPCNNLTGSNRVSRDGLEGKHSALFYDYFRILDLVRCIMSKNR